MSSVIQDYKVKLQTNKDEAGYIAEKLGVTTADVDVLRTYKGIDLDPKGKLVKAIAASMDDVLASGLKLIKGSGMEQELVTLLSKALAKQAADFAVNVLARKFQNDAHVEIAKIPRLPKSETPKAEKAEVEHADL